MPECPRCGREVDSLRMIPPAAITSELVEATDHDADDVTMKGGIEVCTECADELLEE